ncbi:MAG: hypothetical protein AAF667_14610 [Pseudomonadota bacterium]
MGQLAKTSVHADQSVDHALQPAFAPDAREFLNYLRITALNCRSAARADLFRACAMLETDTGVAKSAHAELLMRCLPQVIGKMPKILRPGEQEISFDEAWLLRLFEACRNDDGASFAFLIRTRVVRHAQRKIGFLMRSSTEQFSQN